MGWTQLSSSYASLLSAVLSIEHVQVALFVTVITAFQTPVSQNLSPNPADVTNRVLNNLTAMVFEIAMLNGLKVPLGLSQPEPFRPDRIDQVLTLLWYSALPMSVCLAQYYRVNSSN